MGSGKTASIVREIYLNQNRRLTYSNIKTKKIKHNKLISGKMIISKTIKDYKKKKTGENEPVYELSLNVDYWKSIKEPINVVLDEAHTIVNARRSMSKVNQITTEWLALIRRVLGSSDSGYGELTLISQLPNRIDIIAREMATKIKWHLCHYVKVCKKCEFKWQENSDVPEPAWNCLKCRSHYIFKCNHIIEVWHFRDMNHFLAWKQFGERSYHSHYFINDIEKYFPLYNTLSWDNMFSEFY